MTCSAVLSQNVAPARSTARSCGPTRCGSSERTSSSAGERTLSPASSASSAPDDAPVRAPTLGAATTSTSPARTALHASNPAWPNRSATKYVLASAWTASLASVRCRAVGGVPGSEPGADETTSRSDE